MENLDSFVEVAKSAALLAGHHIKDQKNYFLLIMEEIGLVMIRHHAN